MKSNRRQALTAVAALAAGAALPSVAPAVFDMKSTQFDSTKVAKVIERPYRVVDLWRVYDGRTIYLVGRTSLCPDLQSVCDAIRDPETRYGYNIRVQAQGFRDCSNAMFYGRAIERVRAMVCTGEFAWIHDPKSAFIPPNHARREKLIADGCTNFDWVGPSALTWRMLRGLSEFNWILPQPRCFDILYTSHPHVVMDNLADQLS